MEKCLFNEMLGLALKGELLEAVKANGGEMNCTETCMFALNAISVTVSTPKPAHGDTPPDFERESVVITNTCAEMDARQAAEASERMVAE